MLFCGQTNYNTIGGSPHFFIFPRPRGGGEKSQNYFTLTPGASVTLDPGLGECPQTPLPGLEPKEDAKSLANQRRRQRDAAALMLV